MQDRLHFPYFSFRCRTDSKSTYIFQGVNRSSGDAHHIDPSRGVFVDLYVGFPHLNHFENILKTCMVNENLNQKFLSFFKHVHKNIQSIIKLNISFILITYKCKCLKAHTSLKSLPPSNLWTRPLITLDSGSLVVSSKSRISSLYNWKIY